MVRRIFLFLTLLTAFMACRDDDSFTTSQTARLTFAVDTLRLDTVFANTGSKTYNFWVFNHASDGIRLNSVRLRQGNQTGLRVNVDGSYLDNRLGSVVTNLEVRKDDSIRVFVELTPLETHQLQPQTVADDLVFTLESGVEQVVHLQGYAWDALTMRNVAIHSDTLIESSKPIVVYGGLRVDSTATLTIRNTTLYFHDGPGIDVYGRLITDSATLRGDRLDRMFTYLPYDRVSGQWGKQGGIVIHASSTGNVLRNTVIRNAGSYGILCDSAAYDADQLRLDMQQCVVHNCAGTGLATTGANVRLRQCQFSNMQGDCIAVDGGHADISRCTLAQFYPFTGGRGAALRFGNALPLHGLTCDSSIVTGYDADVVMGVRADTTHVFEFQFANTLLRTPRVETEDSVRFTNIIWESPTDSVQGKQHFRLVDEGNLDYDFHLDSLSTAQGLGCY